MQSLSSYNLKFIVVVILVALLSCSKGKDTPPDGGSNGGGNSNTSTNCLITTVSQVNSGTIPESSLTAFYNSNYDVTKLIVYDSIHKIKNFEANFSFITTDSIRLDIYQYLILDGNKRVIRFVTKGDMSDPGHADDHVFEYSYNGVGYLETKKLFINGSKKANFSTAYSYSNNQLTSCIMIAPSSGNLKVLESTLSYDNNVNLKNYIYTFPDAMEGYPYLTVLNFGKHPPNPLKKVITKIYDPASGNLIDTWTTDYGNYKVANGYVLSGESTGDWQQGIASFYGKTNFYYSCR